MKPQYEISARELVKGRLTDQLSEGVVTRVMTELQTLGINVVKWIASPVRGKQARALEFFLLIRRS